MLKRYLFSALLVLLLTTSCNTLPISQNEQGVPATLAVIQEPGDSQKDTYPPEEFVEPNCLGDEISPIGQSIADDFETASYEQVMTWFCNGAEFEDILVALESESLTDATVDEMLQMLADGFTWEEIWLLVGLTG